MSKPVSIILAALVFACTGLSAQVLGDTLRIEEVSVRKTSQDDVTVKKVSRMDSLTLQQYSMHSLADMLSESSSLFIKSYGRGALASPSFRGMAPSHTRVSWNGLELNNPMLGMVDFSQIPVYFTDEVNLFHGHSQLPGMHGAAGGVVALNNSVDWKNRLSGGYFQGLGSYGSFDEYFRINAGNSKIQSSTRVLFSHSDNRFTYRNTDVIDSIDLETGKRYHPMAENRQAAYGTKALLQELGWRRNEHEMLSVNFWIQESERSIPSLSSNEQGNAILQNLQQDRFLRNTLRYTIYKEKSRLEFFSGLNLSRLYFNTHTRLASGELYRLVLSEAQTLSLDHNLQLQQHIGRRNELMIYLGYARHIARILEEVTETGYDRQRGELKLHSSYSTTWNRHLKTRFSLSQDVMEGKRMSPGISGGLEWDVSGKEEIIMHVGLDAGSRYPGLNDLYMVPGGNPLLKPEYTRSGEAGVRFGRKHGRGEIAMSATAYLSSVRNWIIWLPTFKSYWEPQNIALVKTSGLELSARTSGEVSGVFYRFKADYALTRSINHGDALNRADASAGKQLPYIPLHSGNINSYLRYRNVFLSYTWNYYSERFTTSSNEITSRRDYLYPYFMNQVRGGIRADRHRWDAELSIAVFNLFDEQYRSVLQRPMPGRNFQVLLRIGWKK
jgi:iron complex outermembrane receptor protein